MVIRALEQKGGADVLTAPKVTTLSGRQAQIAIVDLRTIVAGVTLQQNGGGGNNANNNNNNNNGGATAVASQISYNTTPIPFGPVLDVIPYVSADGFSIQMTVIPTISEFVGYDDPGGFIPVAQSVGGTTVAIPLAAQLPLPHLRTRYVTTSCIVWDGQTIAIGGLIAEDIRKIKDKVPVLGDLPILGRFFRSESNSSSKKNLYIFVTPTIIDPAGNRVHNDDDLPFAKNAIPPQSTALRQ
jgi:general secretion pathway protein D